MRNLLANRQGGFTLLEVVFAVGILAIGMMGYTVLKVSNRYSWFFSKNLSQAVQMTNSNLEGLRMAGYNDAGWMSVGNHTQADQNAFGGTPQMQAGDFAASTVTWTVREKCPSELTKLVAYTTKWSNGGSQVTVTQVQVRP